MRIKGFAVTLLFACGLIFGSRVASQVPANNNDAILAPTRLWNIKLSIAADEFDAMQPAAPGAAVDAKRESERNLFGTTFPWVHADFTADDTTVKNVGIRYAGDMTYLVSAGGSKRPLKIAFDKFEKQGFHGLQSIHLHAMPLDPSKSREALAYSIFRACGVPASRTAFAEVTLTVPGKFTDQPLGLYVVVEDVDAAFLKQHFQSADGLALNPFTSLGIEFAGEEWDAYAIRYRPQRKPTKEEQERVIAFAKLVNTASDEEFAKQIGSFIDVEAFLRYIAANALTANLQSFLALGHNYTLYLDPRTNKFHFIPGDLEYSLANLLLFGSPEELMNLSLKKPYPGENKLPDRLLAVQEHAERYDALLRNLSATVFTKQRLAEEAAAIEKAIKAIRDREQRAAAARPAPPAAPFGPPGAVAPQPPSIETFIDQRTTSISDQLAGRSTGYIPRPFQFGPPPVAGGGGRRGGNSTPMSDATFHESVKVPTGFTATLFAAPPQVSYPVAIACEPSGAVYVAVDEQGSLGRTPGGGRILRCVDTNGDGRVDNVTIFAKVEHPRGVTYRDGKVWVMHPPTLSVFQDKDGDGVADSEDILVTGLTTNQISERGGDHTTNCVRMGIDGWLYIGVGDYGIKQATGKDGSSVVMRGGGVVRVRPDGSELEIYCTGLRNPFDLAIDPFLNIFTRDNTNDGAGWDTRVSLLKQSANYGYTQLFANFTDEIMPTLGTFGNSGGTGGLFLQNPSWPEGYNNTLLTGDWGRSEVYRHKLAANGATFDLQQDVFLQVPRATGMDVDALGRLYVASWYGGEASVFVGPNVGFVARITPENLESEPFPNLKQATWDELLQYLASAHSVTRLHAQGEFLARGRNKDATRGLVALAMKDDALLEGRVAALFTLKQLNGKDSHTDLLKLSEIPALREFALRALTDRASEMQGLKPDIFVAALNDPSARVRAQALISFGRLGDPSAAPSIISLTSREKDSEMPTRGPVQNQPDPGRVIPHLAVRALVALNAVDACVEALDGQHASGALWAMRSMQNQEAVDGLIKRLRTAHDPALRRGILVTLIRLYHHEAEYDGSWWGIRPDSTGPYYDRVEWEMTTRIGEVLLAAIRDSDSDTVKYLRRELQRHQVSLPGDKNEASLTGNEEDKPIVLPKADPNSPDQIGNLSVEAAISRTLEVNGDPMRGAALFRTQACIACHTTADGQTPKGPYLLEIGKRYNSAELIESILKPSDKLAQGYEMYQFLLTDGRIVQGYIVSQRANSTIIREPNGMQKEINKDDVEEKRMQTQSAMPDGLVANLTPKQLADLVAYLQSLK